MSNRKMKIENEREYHVTMKKIDALMKKGEKNLTDKEAEEIRILALAAQRYERSIYTRLAPKTPEGFNVVDLLQTRHKNHIKL